MMYDLFVEKNICDEGLVSNIAELLNVKFSDVLLVDDIAKIVDHREYPVMVVKRRHKNGYEMFISIFARQNIYDEPEFTRKFSRTIGMNVLYAANSDDMYEWMKISPDGECEHVILCVDPFDENEDAVLCNSSVNDNN
jgi:hypothetical protein